MNLPKITNKQAAILEFLYSYRFLDRIQIQTCMGHKDYGLINIWLKDLREKQYVEWIYSTDFAEKTKPAMYYLGINGIRFLKSTNDYPRDELRKRYKEASRSRSYIDRCILVADCCITMNKQSLGGLKYYPITPADYIDRQNTYHFLSELAPHLCFVKQESALESTTTQGYLLEVFDPTLPRYRLKHRLKVYLDYLDYGEWERETHHTAPPIILLVCPTKTELIYAKRRTKWLLENEHTDNTKYAFIKFTTIAELQHQGVTGQIWEPVTARKG
jgi:hypothetical protein